MTMVLDEPALWATVPERLREKVDVAAVAICKASGECGDCPGGGRSCVAFGLYGVEAIAAVDALDRLFLGRIMAEVRASAPAAPREKRSQSAQDVHAGARAAKTLRGHGASGAR
jgi:hypothetical protein